MKAGLTRKQARVALALATIAAALHSTAGRAADAPSSYRVLRGEVRVVCPLTVGGLFEAKTEAVSGTIGLGAASPGALRGELQVDLSTLDTGIALRNTHLRDKYLEVGRGAEYASAVLSGVHLGKVEGSSFQGSTPFRGTLLLHGTRRPVAGQADIRLEAGQVRVAASFPVRIDAYGIAPPRYLGVGVKNEVQVKVSLVAAPVTTPAAEGTR
jgi:polyisoprenoid-binding protein YceI